MAPCRGNGDDSAMHPLLLAAIFVVLALPAAAQDRTEVPLEPPELPPTAYRGEIVEPEVTIVESEQDTLYEYWVRGRLYMVKVQPSAGRPYYLLDTDGDGQLDVRKDRVWENTLHQWVLFRW